jgi:mono/diheme cytochrome c family protein
MLRILFGILLGMVLVPAAAMLYLQNGNVPVAVADKPFPKEREFTGNALHARIDRDAPKFAPIQADEQNLVAGAHIYKDQCAVCHGIHGTRASIGANMYPVAPPLWEKHQTSDVVGVSDDPVGETFWKVSNGIRLTGMPAFQGVLNDTQMWQVSLLLANADKPLPPAAVELVGGQAVKPAAK